MAKLIEKIRAEREANLVRRLQLLEGITKEVAKLSQEEVDDELAVHISNGFCVHVHTPKDPSAPFGPPEDRRSLLVDIRLLSHPDYK